MEHFKVVGTTGKAVCKYCLKSYSHKKDGTITYYMKSHLNQLHDIHISTDSSDDEDQYSEDENTTTSSEINVANANESVMLNLPDIEQMRETMKKYEDDYDEIVKFVIKGTRELKQTMEKANEKKMVFVSTPMLLKMSKKHL